MANVIINSIVRFDEVYINCENLVKALYRDLSMAKTPELKAYLQENIENWEKYMEDARKDKKPF